MQFLAKHYEKIILAVLLFLFGLSMIYLMVIISSADELKAEQLEIKPRKADWKDMHNIDFKGDDFIYNTAFMRDTDWQPSGNRSNDEKVFSDLLVMVATSRCPHCIRFVPRQYYFRELNKCPFCQGELIDPGPVPEGPVITQQERSGIPDDVKIKWGLDPRDPSNDHDDMDGDGFSNLIEYQEKTDLKDPRSHPPMFMRLYLFSARQVELDPILMKVTVSGDKKENWDIQINTDGGSKTRFMVLGDSINLEPKRRYKIVDVISDVKIIQDGGVEVQRDESKIVLESDDENKYKVTMQVGKVAFSPLQKAFLKDISTEREFGVDVGDKFRVGNRTTGVTEYTVRKIDIDKKEVEVTASRNRKGTIGSTPLFKLNKKRSIGEDPTMQGIPGY